MRLAASLQREKGQWRSRNGRYGESFAACEKLWWGRVDAPFSGRSKYFRLDERCQLNINTGVNMSGRSAHTHVGHCKDLCLLCSSFPVSEALFFSILLQK